MSRRSDAARELERRTMEQGVAAAEEVERWKGVKFPPMFEEEAQPKDEPHSRVSFRRGRQALKEDME